MVDGGLYDMLESKSSLRVLLKFATESRMTSVRQRPFRQKDVILDSGAKFSSTCYDDLLSNMS